MATASAHRNEVPIKVEKNLIGLSTRYLESATAFVWVGWWFGPTDNDNGRVLETRDLMHRYYDYVPHGMSVGNLDGNGRFTTPLIDELANGYFALRLVGWPEGIYRFNYHGPQQRGFAVEGQRRDSEVLWARWWSDDVPFPAKSQIQDFVYEEPNRAGHCFRVLIDRDRSVKPFGNLDSIKKGRS